MKTKSLFGFYLFYWVITSFLFITLTGCGGFTGKNAVMKNQTGQSAVAPVKWTLVSGDNMVNTPVNYGTGGIAGSTNTPGARYGSISWSDSKGNLWLFGGDSGRNTEKLHNDLWKFDGTNWIWVSGDRNANQPANYGTRGVTASANIPGARCGSVSWIDSKDNLWFFGGYGYGPKKQKGYLNDLWKFDGSNWTWVSGDNKIDYSGIHGTRGVAGETNKPGARLYSVSWIDSKDNLWLFGGQGFAGTGLSGYLNDLWKFDGKSWIWVSGDFKQNQEGVYGTMGVPDNANIPGAREGSVSWTDSKDNLWLFGGVGADRYRIDGEMNDLWKFDGTNWTWVSGESAAHNWQGVYGTMGVPDKSNRPKARSGGMSWIDSKDNLWLFGGVSSNLNLGQKPLLNDLWKFDGTSWTWISGVNPENRYKDEDPNDPRARFKGVSWVDNKGNLWLFGGRKITNHFFSDLWKFEP